MDARLPGMPSFYSERRTEQIWDTLLADDHDDEHDQNISLCRATPNARLESPKPEGARCTR